MKTLTWLTVFTIIVAMVMAFAIFIQQSEAHYNTKTVTDVRELCWLIGYPNRTLCRDINFTRIEKFFTFADHTWVRKNGEVVLDHKPGHQNHAQVDKGPFRTTEHKNVFSDCSECD